MYKKSLSWSILFCAIILIGAGCSNLQPIKQSTNYVEVQTESVVAGTYKSEKFGYQFVYPEDATLSDFIEPSVASNIKQVGGLYFGSANVHITVYDRALEKNVVAGFEPTQMAKYGQFKQVKIGETETWQYASYGAMDYWFINTVFVGEQFTYVFQYSSPEKNNPVDIAAYESILNSFVTTK